MLVFSFFSIVPIDDGKMYSWVIQKGLSFSNQYNCPIFSQKKFFDLVNYNISENGLKSNEYERFDGKISDWKGDAVVFPEEKIQAYLRRHASETDAYESSLSNSWQEMTDFMVTQIRRLEMQREEKVEAILSFHAPHFVLDAANQLGVPLLGTEWGPLRPPYYRKTAYFMFGRLNNEGELCRRYEEFQKQIDPSLIFTKREILALMLQKEYVHYAVEEDAVPEYEAGIALGYNTSFVYSPGCHASAPEVVYRTQKIYRNEDIAVRYHPGDPVHSRIYGVQEDKSNLLQFFRNVKRVVSISSNVSYEAMLFNRPTYDMGNIDFHYFGNGAIEIQNDYIADDSFMSFVAFGYLVPFELLNSMQYIRWRLTNPTEQEIYLYHLRYYLNCLGLGKEILMMGQGNRLNAIVENRIDMRKENMDQQEMPIWGIEDEVTRLYAQMKRQEVTGNIRISDLEQLVQEKDQNMNQLQQNIEQLVQIQNALRFELDDIQSSFSWKIILFLQKMRSIFLPKRR